jgi:hypothetical protein
MLFANNLDILWEPSLFLVVQIMEQFQQTFHMTMCNVTVQRQHSMLARISMSMTVAQQRVLALFVGLAQLLQLVGLLIITWWLCNLILQFNCVPDC